MCECGCSYIRQDLVRSYKGMTLCVDIYPGCAECGPVIGVDLRAFNSKGVKDWLNGRTGGEIVPDEYGGLPTMASLPLFDMAGLGAGLQEECGDITNWFLPDIYDSWADFVEDHGLRIIQAAIRHGDKLREIAHTDCQKVVEE